MTSDDTGDSEATLTISTLGPAGTYSHQAASQFFGSSADLRLKQTISNVFEDVEEGTSARGIAPVENSTNGQVKETHVCLSKYKVEVLGKTTLDIGHALLRHKQPGTASIDRIYSHEQGLGQCKRYLAARYPQAKCQAVDSTALAARMAAQDPSSIAVASLMCATVYDLQILDTDIQDGQANRTTFIAFKKAL